MTHDTLARMFWNRVERSGAKPAQQAKRDGKWITATWSQVGQAVRESGVPHADDLVESVRSSFTCVIDIVPPAAAADDPWARYPGASGPAPADETGDGLPLVLPPIVADAPTEAVPPIEQAEPEIVADAASRSPDTDSGSHPGTGAATLLSFASIRTTAPDLASAVQTASSVATAPGASVTRMVASGFRREIGIWAAGAAVCAITRTALKIACRTMRRHHT